MKSFNRVCLLCLVPWLMLATGCSTYERDWKRAGAAAAQDPLVGRWQGSWRSDKNGHHGGLRCLITRVDPNTCDARFRATYLKIFCYTHTARLTTATTGDGLTWVGSEDLGWLAGGRYDYKAEIRGDRFLSTYDCPRDHGVFEMTRVSPSTP